MPAVVNSRRNELNSLGSRKWQLLVRLARCRPNRSRFGYVEFCLTSDNSELKILSQPQSLSLLALDSIDQFLRDIQQITNQLGITIESALSEAGIGQIELVLAPQTDLVQLADAILILKHSLLAYAQAKGMSVSFKAKPDKHLSGNGMHCHLSIEDSNLENLFAKDEVSFKAAIAGILNILIPATAILAPLPESYDRFQENSHAPTNIGWVTIIEP